MTTKNKYYFAHNAISKYNCRNFGDKDVEYIKQIISTGMYNTLNLSKFPISSIKYLCKILSDYIIYIDRLILINIIRENDETDDELSILFETIKNSDIRKLMLATPTIGAHAFGSLCDLYKNSNLCYLSVDIDQYPTTFFKIFDNNSITQLTLTSHAQSYYLGFHKSFDFRYIQRIMNIKSDSISEKELYLKCVSEDFLQKTLESINNYNTPICTLKFKNCNIENPEMLLEFLHNNFYIKNLELYDQYDTPIYLIEDLLKIIFESGKIKRFMLDSKNVDEKIVYIISDFVSENESLTEIFLDFGSAVPVFNDHNCEYLEKKLEDNHTLCNTNLSFIVPNIAPILLRNQKNLGDVRFSKTKLPNKQ